MPKRSSEELGLQFDIVTPIIAIFLFVNSFVGLWGEYLKHVRHFKFKFFNNYVHNTNKYQVSAKVLVCISFSTKISLFTALIRQTKIHYTIKHSIYKMFVINIRS